MKSKWTPDQILAVRKDINNGMTVAEATKKAGIKAHTFYNREQALRKNRKTAKRLRVWTMPSPITVDVQQADRLQVLTKENAKLRSIVNLLLGA